MGYGYGATTKRMQQTQLQYLGRVYLPHILQVRVNHLTIMCLPFSFDDDTIFPLHALVTPPQKQLPSGMSIDIPK